MASLSVADKRLGAVLLERGDVTDTALQEAMQRSDASGERLADALVHLGVVSEERIAHAIEHALGVPRVALPRIDVEADAIASLEGDVALRLGAVPFARRDHHLRVAFRDPLDMLAVEAVEDASGCVVERFQALG